MEDLSKRLDDSLCKKYVYVSSIVDIQRRVDQTVCVTTAAAAAAAVITLNNRCVDLSSGNQCWISQLAAAC